MSLYSDSASSSEGASPIDVDGGAPSPDTGRAPRPKRPKIVIINTSDTRYHVVRTAATALGWVVDDQDREGVPSQFHGMELPPRSVSSLVPRRYRKSYDVETTPQVVWRDTSVLASRVSKLLPHQRLNHYPSMNCIARKAVVFRRLMKVMDAAYKEPLPRHLAECVRSFAPLSFSSASGAHNLDAYSTHGGTINTNTYFIIKPNKSCSGKGIRITRTPLKELTPEELTTEGEALVQTYIKRPLLIEGKKFDLRLYVLITGLTTPGKQVGSAIPGRGVAPYTHPDDSDANLPEALRGLRIYVHTRGLVRMCAQPYVDPTEENCSDPTVHLTNYAVNKKSENYTIGTYPDEANDDGEQPMVSDGLKRDMNYLAHMINSGGTSEEAEGCTKWDGVLRRIHEALVLTVLSGVNILRREFKAAGGVRGAKADGRSCFELLGFDVMLREKDLSPVLMEANHSPSLFCDSDYDFFVKQGVLRDVGTLLSTHIAPLQHCGSSAAYAQYMSDHASSMHDKEQALVSAPDFGFTQLLPHYVRGSVPTEDWSEIEREKQKQMLAFATAIPA